MDKRMTRRLFSLLSLALLCWLQYALLWRFALMLDATLLLVWWLRWWTARRVAYRKVGRRNP